MCEILDDADMDSREVLHEAGLARTWPKTPSTVTFPNVMRFQRAFARATDRRRELWSVTGGRLTLLPTQPYGAATRTAPTVRSLVRVLTRGQLFFIRIAIAPLYDAGGELIGLEIDSSPAPSDLREFSETVATVAHIRSWDSIWAGSFPYTRMELPSTVSVDSISRRYHRNIARTTSRPRLFWHSRTNDRRLPGANESLHQRFVNELEGHIAELRAMRSIPDRVRDRLLAPGGVTSSLVEVAGELGLSPRSLQRTLRVEGYSFRDLQISAKQALATRALRDTSTPIAEIARALGYSSGSSFSDAFRAWFGKPPSVFRPEGHAQGEGH